MDPEITNALFCTVSRSLTGTDLLPYAWGALVCLAVTRLGWGVVSKCNCHIIRRRDLNRTNYRKQMLPQGGLPARAHISMTTSQEREYQHAATHLYN
jgi:hypothetical protein